MASGLGELSNHRPISDHEKRCVCTWPSHPGQHRCDFTHGNIRALEKDADYGLGASFRLTHLLLNALGLSVVFTLSPQGKSLQCKEARLRNTIPKGVFLSQSIIERGVGEGKNTFLFTHFGFLVRTL